MSKLPTRVYVRVKGQDLSVDLPKEFQQKFPAGDQAWISLVGVCGMEPQGGPFTAESSDGLVEVEKVVFYDQVKGHVESIKIGE